MTTLEQVALVAAAVWLLCLTAAVLVLVRQVGLITVRLSLALPHYDVDDLGPTTGQPVPAPLLQSLDAAATGSSDLLFFSSTCSPCREVAESLRTVALHGHTLALVAGEPDGARGFAELLPTGMAVRFDPQASEAAQELGVQAVPYAVRVTDGVVARKAYLKSVADLDRLTGPTPLSAAGTTSEGGR